MVRCALLFQYSLLVANHLEVCPQLGRAIATHNSIRDALAHMVKQCGLADAAVVEIPVTAADGDTTVADVVYFDSLSGERAILEVSVVTVGSDTSLARTSRVGLDSHRVIQKITNEAGNHYFYPHRFVGLWSDGPVDDGLPEGCLRPGKSGWQVQHDAETGHEVHVEHHGGVVVLGHASERGVHGDRRGVPEPHRHP